MRWFLDAAISAMAAMAIGVLLILATTPSSTQIPSVTVVGPVTANHCMGSLTTLQLQDTGVGCVGGAISGVSTLGVTTLNSTTINNSGVATSASLVGNGTSPQLTLGANGGNGGGAQFNGATSGSGSITAAATGGLNVSPQAGQLTTFSTGISGTTASFSSTVTGTSHIFNGATSGATTVTPQAVASGTITLPTGPGVLLASTDAITSLAVGNPTGTTSTTAVMGGVGGSCAITPKSSTRVLAIFVGTMINTIANGLTTVRLRFGTGGAPANGVAATGTLFGGSSFTQGAANGLYSLPTVGVMTSLTPGTAYWVDFDQAASTGGGTASYQNLTCTLIEL